MRVYDSNSHQQIGNLVDITSKGIMGVSEHPLPKGETTRLRLESSNEVAEKPFMEFSAINKWCEQDIIPNTYNTGFEILDLTEEDAGIIGQIVQEFGFRDNKPVG